MSTTGRACSDVDSAGCLPDACSVHRGAVVYSLTSRWWIAFTLSTICVVSGHLLIKHGLNVNLTMQAHGIYARILSILTQPSVDFGLAIYLLGTVCWMVAVSQKEISFLYPLSSINYVLVVILSALLLSEPVRIRRAEGVCLIVLGMVLLNLRRRKRPL